MNRLAAINFLKYIFDGIFDEKEIDYFEADVADVYDLIEGLSVVGSQIVKLKFGFEDGNPQSFTNIVRIINHEEDLASSLTYSRCQQRLRDIRHRLIRAWSGRYEAIVLDKICRDISLGVDR